MVAGDEAGWTEYHRRLYDLDAAPNGFVRWKIQSTGVSVARQLASARNRRVAAYTEAHGEDPLGWPLLHPPAVLWIPHAATAACLSCWWLDNHCANVDAAAFFRPAPCKRVPRAG